MAGLKSNSTFLVSTVRYCTIYSRDKKDTDPYNISTMEKGSLWQSKNYLQNAASLLSREYGNRRGLDLSKEVL